MRKLAAVEEARILFNEAIEWGVFKWLMEKRRVRETADRATDALFAVEQKVKDSWPDELKLAYNELAEAEEKGKSRKGNGKTNGAVSAEALRIAEEVKAADDEAYRVRMEAEDIFAEAERKMSIPMAKQGSKKTLESYDLHEAAIRKAESAGKSKS